MRFQFKIVSEYDLLVLKSWFNKSHVIKWFGETEVWLEEIRDQILFQV